MKYADSTKTISTVIPTHNRKETLKQTLDALCSQTFDPNELEVIVVADGCTDGTVDMLKTYHAPYRLQVLEQEGKGPGSARNHGAKIANGLILLFLDDDVVPTPSLIEEHVKTHKDYPGHVVIGYISLKPHAKKDFFYIELRSWWESILTQMFTHGYRLKYCDLLGGNFSINSDDFKSLNGFDPNFVIHEDSEFGVRLIKAGIPMIPNLKAKGNHHDETKLDYYINKRFHDGKADAKMVLVHPEVLPDLSLSRIEKYNTSLRERIHFCIAFKLPRFGDLIGKLVRLSLNPLEYLKLRALWKFLFYNLCYYRSLRGVREEIGTIENLRAIVKGSRAKIDVNTKTVSLDLRAGIDCAEDLLDREKPSSAVINFGKHKIGIIPPEPCSEPLRGAHLRPILANEFSVPLLLALALEGEIISASEKECENLSNIIRLKSIYSGKPTPDKIWSDRHDQWQRLEGKKSDSISFWEIQEKIRELEKKKESAEREWRQIKKIAQEKEAKIKAQMKIIQNV